ncbi:hypothetical protein FRC11_014588 [Ceratobasidium sp. 423]|nr:hypothetical protein FRC11_014588 [Ceratobasidium sp. 423]
MQGSTKNGMQRIWNSGSGAPIVVTSIQLPHVARIQTWAWAIQRVVRTGWGIRGTQTRAELALGRPKFHKATDGHEEASSTSVRWPRHPPISMKSRRATPEAGSAGWVNHKRAETARLATAMSSRVLVSLLASEI